MTSNSLTIFLLGFVLLLGSLGADELGVGDIELLEFKVLQEGYRRKLDEIAAKAMKAEIQPLIEKYDAALGRLSDSEAEAGKLANVLLIRDERERAKKELSLKQEQLVSGHSPLLKIQKKLMVELDKIEKGVDGRKDVVRAAYVKKLESLKVQYTKKKMIDEAVVVDGELKSLRVNSVDAGSRGGFFDKDEDDERSKVEGLWMLKRYDGYTIGDVAISKAGKGKIKLEGVPNSVPEDTEAVLRNYRRQMLGAVSAPYSVEEEGFRKNAEKGDAWAKVLWEKDGRELVCTKDNFKGYRLVRSKKAKSRSE